MIFGLPIGALNFINIAAYVYVHRNMPNQTILIFIATDIGILLVATFLGVLVFHESITYNKLLGIISGIFSIF